MTFLFAAFLTVFSSKFTSVAKVCQRIQSLIDNKNNIAAAAAVPPMTTAAFVRKSRRDNDAWPRP